MAFLQGLNDGSTTFVDNPVFLTLADYLLYDVSKCTNPMNTDFNTQTSLFSNQEVAMTLGGNWNQPTLDEAGPDLSAGLMPFPIDDDKEANDMLFAGVTGYWGINKDSEAKEEIKEFFTWLSTTPEGQKCMTTDLQMIPAFRSFEADPDSIGELGTDLSSYINQGKVYGMYHSYYPDGFAQAAGEAVQKLVAGNIDGAAFTRELQNGWDNLKTE